MDKPGAAVHGSVCRGLPCAAVCAGGRRCPRHLQRLSFGAKECGLSLVTAREAHLCGDRGSLGRMWIAALTLFARNDGRWMAMTDKEGAMTKEEEAPGWRGKRSQSFLPEPGQRCRLGIRRKKCH